MLCEKELCALETLLPYVEKRGRVNAGDYKQAVSVLISHIREQEAVIAAKDAELAHQRRALKWLCQEFPTTLLESIRSLGSRATADDLWDAKEWESKAFDATKD